MSTKDRKTLVKWEIAGVFFIFMARSVLHFLFDWLNRWEPVAIVRQSMKAPGSI